MAKKSSNDTPVDTPPPDDDLRTEQEKDQSADVPGVGPAGKAVGTPGPVKTIEEEGIGPRTPYPDGAPPPAPVYTPPPAPMNTPPPDPTE